MTSTVLVATWGAGLFVVSSGTHEQEMANHSVRALARDGHGGAIAIVDRRSLCRRAPSGVWSTIATAEIDLACCMIVGDIIYAGTDDASVLHVTAAADIEQLWGFDNLAGRSGDIEQLQGFDRLAGRGGEIEQLRGFKNVAGRDKWYAGSAVIDGKVMGPPLGIRSMTATSDGAVLLANVHVGGIPRSVDGGATWQPTIDIDSDVHEVRAHPNRPGIVAAAAAVGLCTSIDGGATWKIETTGLHASYCSAVEFAGDDILVAAEAGHFAPHGAIYRRGVDESGPLVRVSGGLPEWLDGIADTGCIAAKGSAVAVADQKGNLHVSTDNGRTWSRWADSIPYPSCILIV